ncbi:MAG TPA: chorismate mutase [Alphaproteobacteria bacterium]|nr:chorismate mutase [Alphaproteobacteria bacterium]
MDAAHISRILSPYRARIDVLDDRIVALLAERFDIVHEVADLKAAHEIPSVLQDRVVAVLDRTEQAARRVGLDPSLTRALYTLLIDHAHEIEDAAKTRADPARLRQSGS